MKECNAEIGVGPSEPERPINPPTSSNKLDLFRNDVIYSCRPIYLVSRIFGLLPFSIRRDANGEVQRAQLSISDIIWFVISVSGYLLLAYYCTQAAQIGMNSKGSYFLRIYDDIGIILCFIFGAIYISSNMYNRSRLIDILKDFSIFDEKVKHLYSFEFH